MSELSEEIRAFIEGGMPPLDMEEIRARAARSPIGLKEHPRRRLPAALIVVGAAAALIAVLVLSPWTVRGPTPAGAESELLLLASRANDVPKLGPGQYVYSELETLGPYSIGGPGPRYAINEYWTETNQMWINAQGYGRFVQTIHDTPHFFSPQDRRNWLRAGSPNNNPGLDQPVRSGGIAPTLDLAPTPHFDVGGLPTKTAALREVLASSQFEKQLPVEALECHDNTTCLVVIKAAAILQGPDIGATPALRRALFDLLAHVPGVVNRGTVKDHAGVSGIELTYVDRIPAHIQIDTCGNAEQSHKVNVQVYVPASSNTFSFIVNPITTQVIETEQIPTPSYQAVLLNPCIESSGTMKQFNPPHWVTVSKEIVVGSETSTAPVGSTHS